jgi:hypothetical protein
MTNPVKKPVQQLRPLRAEAAAAVLEAATETETATVEATATATATKTKTKTTTDQGLVKRNLRNLGCCSRQACRLKGWAGKPGKKKK